MQVYIDILILLNFVVDLLLLMGTNLLSGWSPNLKRSVPAAIFGGVYAGVCILPGFVFLSHALGRIVSLAIVSIIAFGLDRNALHRSVMFVFLNMALGGIVLILGKGGFWSVLLSAGILIGLCVIGFRGKATKTEYVTVTIRYGKKMISMTALLDTGNTLKDPVTGHPVLVADSRVAWELLQLQESELSDPIGTISRGNHLGLRLIPYCSVGQPAGMLLGLKVDELRINGREANQIVAFAPNRIGQGCGYEALTGGVL
jgi:stage II sporulation protein GA (sporulation sigma-E factor processing peptidase)